MLRFKIVNNEIQILDENNIVKNTITADEAKLLFSKTTQIKEILFGKKHEKKNNNIFYQRKAIDSLGNNEYDRAKYYADRYLKEIEKEAPNSELFDKANTWYKEFVENIQKLR